MTARFETRKQEAQNAMRNGKIYEFPFTIKDFQYIKSLIYQIAGISLSPSKKDLVYSRLARRLRARQIDSFSNYIRLLESGDVQEKEEFTNALTTNMTSFFREQHHFEILSNFFTTLPGSAPIHIWTCASSTGEEPYSIAMTVVEHFKSFTTPVRILATDIDTKVLEKAKLGIYCIDQMQNLSSDKIKQFFLKGCGKNAGLAKVRPELQQMITFKPFNLLDEKWEFREKFDAVFCRNVMIYFDRKTQREILKKIKPHMKPRSLFFAGHSENFHHAADLFDIHGKTVYAPKNCQPIVKEKRVNA